ncbi:MAG: hypothetical protein L0Z73_04320 [Gammaproteobacteria bacterium]|nr:hypothetical protein [Gammaproteobacteria bacterium]
MAANEESTKVETGAREEVSATKKDRWDKIDILLKPVGGLFTGIALAIVGYFTTNLLEQQQAEQTSRMAQQQTDETNRRLYTEIMSSRERADSDLRKEMFNSIIKAFLDPQKASLDEKVLALELLAYNFHDVIDLTPLFKYVAKAIEESAIANKAALNAQLERVAREVIDKQLAALAEAGALTTLSVVFEQVGKGGQSFDEKLYPVRADVSGLPVQRYIFVEALHIYPETREIKLRLESGDPQDRFSPEIDIIFKVGFFDFPMIDNTRLSHSQRVGIALTRWTDYGAELALVYFPGSRASLKEKPYYDEVIEHLQQTKAALIERGKAQ